MQLSVETRRKLEKLLLPVLAEIRPSPEEVSAANEYSNELMGRLKRLLSKDVEIILAGSVARGTQIRGSSDIDIFLLFPKGMQERTMEAEALRVAKKIVSRKAGESYEINYAEHPYLKLKNREGFNADIVPAFKIRDASDMGTSVDRTQLHNEFVKSHLRKGQLDEVRLLKYFLREHGIYGAEARVSGFSGYLCELLIYHYGSFISLLEHVSDAKLPIAIDIASNKALAEPAEVAEMLKRFGSQLIVIDPTDKDRNVAANVSADSLARLIMASRVLLSHPSKLAFYGPKYSDTNPRKWLSQLIAKYGFDVHTLAFRLPRISEDTLWPQLKHLAGSVRRELEACGFEPLLVLQHIEGTEAIISVFTNRIVANAAVVMGPPVTMAEGTRRFYSKHKGGSNISIDGGRIFSIEQAEFSTPEEALRHMLSDRNFKFPSYIKKSKTVLHGASMSSKHARMLMAAYEQTMNI